MLTEDRLYHFTTLNLLPTYKSEQKELFVTKYTFLLCKHIKIIIKNYFSFLTKLNVVIGNKLIHSYKELGRIKSTSI